MWLEPEPEPEPKLWTKVGPETEPKINNFGSATLNLKFRSGSQSSQVPLTPGYTKLETSVPVRTLKLSHLGHD